MKGEFLIGLSCRLKFWVRWIRNIAIADPFFFVWIPLMKVKARFNCTCAIRVHNWENINKVVYNLGSGSKNNCYKQNKSHLAKQSIRNSLWKISLES